MSRKCRNHPVLMCVGFAVFLGGLFICWLLLHRSQLYGDSEVSIVCMKTTGDADCSLIYQKGAAVLIDSGTEADAEHILEVLKNCGVGKLDYLILSHSDSDHIGGARKIAEKVAIGCVVESGYEEEAKLGELNAFFDAQGISVFYPIHSQKISVGGMRLVVYPPLEKHYKDTNNYSLAVLVQHKNVNMFFAGDALRKRSEELLLNSWPHMNLYKVAHHGRANAASGGLFDALAPEYAVITAEAADREILDAAKRNQTTVVYTAEGDHIFVSDGKTLTVR